MNENTETLTVHPKGEGFEIIVQHDQSGSAYGMELSKSAYEQLRLHFVMVPVCACMFEEWIESGNNLICSKCDRIMISLTEL